MIIVIRLAIMPLYLVENDSEIKQDIIHYFVAFLNKSKKRAKF